jgi:two-component system alkaline phosphatase synthesis response regulator PhoP
MSVNPDVLIVDDEQSISELLGFWVSEAGYEFTIANNGLEACAILNHSTPKLILLDVMMPKMNGFEVFEFMLSKPALMDVKVIFLTAMSDDESHLKGLDMGADDYIVKPVKQQILMSKIKNYIKKSVTVQYKKNRLHFENLEINRTNYNVLYNGESVTLARKEFELLWLLAEQPNVVFDRNQILDRIWGSDVIVGDRTIDVHIRKIRKKINDDIIVTLKGIGYKFTKS